MRKLTDIDCSNICNDYLLGLSYILLSKKYNICTWSIGNVLKKNNIKSRIRKHNCNEDYFETINTDEKAFKFSFYPQRRVVPAEKRGRYL